MIINDLKELKKKEEDICKLESEIEELEKVKELKKIKDEKLALEKKIKTLSSYKIEQIADIITKLMEFFEGIEYFYENSFFDNNEYNIFPKKNGTNEFINIYPSLSLKITNTKQFLSDEESSICFLPPSPYESCISVEYVQKFIDYLYVERSKNNLLEITNEQLEQILNNFIKSSSQIHLERKKEIANKIETKIKQQKRKEFEESCVISRKLIYNSLSYIINHYESDMIARKQGDEEWSYKSQWSELYGYHKLIIEYDSKKTIYSTVVNKIGCYPDEEYCFRGFHIDTDEDTKIPFFDIKNKLLPIINNSTYIKNFMSMIENLYYENKNITTDNIQEVLVLISNENKANKKLLLK